MKKNIIKIDVGEVAMDAVGVLVRVMTSNAPAGESARILNHMSVLGPRELEMFADELKHRGV